MRVGLDAGRHPYEDSPDTGFRSTLDLVEGVDHDQARTRTRGGLQLLVALVVPVHDEPLAGQPGKQRELELAEGRDVRAQPFGSEQLEHGRVRERLDPVDDQRVRRSAPVRPGGADDRALLVDDERRAVLGGEGLQPDPAHRQLAVHDRGRLGEELEHRGHLAYDRQPASREGLSSGAPTPGRPRRSRRAAGSSLRPAGWPVCGSRPSAS